MNKNDKSIQLRYRRLGILKHFLIAVVLLSGCTLTGYADPITTSILVGLAVSAATTAATYAITALTAPKVKPVDKNKLQGEIQISNTGEDLFINEIYGARESDGFGGIKVGVIYFHASEIRKVVVETSGGGGGKSGGKGGPKTPPTKEHHYYIDLACMVGLGATRVLEIKAGTDVIYRNYPLRAGVIDGTSYEAESAAKSGAYTVIADPTFSNGSKVKLDAGGALTFSVTGDGRPRGLYIFYTAASDLTLDVTINGVVQSVSLPNSYNRIETVMVVARTAIGATPVVLHAPVNNIYLDKITVGEPFFDNDRTIRFGGISGVRDPNYVNPISSYNPFDLFDPNASDYRATNEYNFQENPNTLGEISGSASAGGSLPAGCSLRLYEGNDVQLPDPLLQAYYEAKYGAGSTPAFRNRAYFVLDNFEITKYGSVPNITVVAESVNNTSLGAMCASRSLRGGLRADEFDYAAFNDVPIRGYVISQRQAPKTEIDILNRVFDVDVFENTGGKIQAVVPSDSVVAQIPLTDLDVAENGAESEKSANPVAVESVVRNEYEMPRRLDLSYFDPQKNFEIGNSHATREVTVSEKRENIETSLVLTQNEAQKIVDRLHQKEWAEKDGDSFTTFYKWGWLEPTDLVEVQDLTGRWNPVRLKARNGNIPGKLKFAGVSRNLPEPFERIFTQTSADAHTPPWVKVPPHVVGTLVDNVQLRTTENVLGVYAACAMTDGAYTFSGAALFWERTTGYELLQNLDKQATLGRTLGGAAGTLADVPAGWTAGDWDTTSTLTFDLFYGEVETRTDAEVLDRFNILVVGTEVIAFANAARVTGYANRWTISRLQRQLKKTSSVGHAAAERVLLLTDAVKFIPFDASEVGQTRNYKYLSPGQALESASSFAFTFNSANTEITAPTIYQSGTDATNTTFNLGVNGYTDGAKFRKIEVSSSSDMSGAAATLVRASGYPNNQLPAVTTITKTGEEAAVTKYYRVLHSSNNVDFSAVSNVLAVTFASAVGTGGSGGGAGGSPSAPTDLTVTNGASGQGNDYILSWVNHGAPGANRLWRKKGVAGAWVALPDQTAAATSYSGSIGIAANAAGTYYFRIDNASAPGVYSYSGEIYLAYAPV